MGDGNGDGREHWGGWAISTRRVKFCWEKRKKNGNEFFEMYFIDRRGRRRRNRVAESK